MPTVKRSTRPPWLPERVAHGRRTTTNATLYNSKRWRSLSLRHKMNNPLCVACMDEGVSTPVEVSDHITPINQGGDPYASSNLQSLCHKCHNIKSGKEAHPGGTLDT